LHDFKVFRRHNWKIAAGAAPHLEQTAGPRRGSVVGLALEEPELSPRELATSFVGQQQ
jgi:hypothetical protein